MQFEEPSALTAPTSHTLHSVAPLDKAYEPATQFVHEAAPGEAEKVPGLHRLQLLDPGAAYEPEGQHTRAPVKKNQRRGSMLGLMVNGPISLLKRGLETTYLCMKLPYYLDKRGRPTVPRWGCSGPLHRRCRPRPLLPSRSLQDRCCTRWTHRLRNIPLHSTPSEGT